MTQGQPQITTVIPTYRRPQLLARAIRSVLRQTYPYFQVCVYDNASGDETADVVAELAARDPRVKYHCHAVNLGGGANVEFGRGQVTTPFYNILYDDDLLLPDFFATAMEGFRQHPDAMLSATETIYWYAPSDRVYHAAIHHWPRDGYFGVPHEAPVDNIFFYPHFSGIVWRREIIDALGPLQKFPHGDLECSLRACCRFPFVVSKKPGAILWAHVGSEQRVLGFEEFRPMLTEYSAIVSRDGQIPPQVRQRILDLIPKNVQWSLYYTMIQWLRAGRFGDAARAIDVLRTDFGLSYRGAAFSWLNRACQSRRWAHRLVNWACNVHDWIDLHLGSLRPVQAAYAQLARDAVAQYPLEPAGFTRNSQHA